MNTILLLDDDPSYLDMTRRFLEEEDNRIITANSGEEALGILEQDPVDVLVTDLMMPGLSGLDVITRVTDDFPETAIIVISGQENLETAVEAMKLGSFDYIRKPATPESLRFGIRSALEKMHLRRELETANHKLRKTLDEQTGALAKSRSLFQSLVENSPVILIELDCDFRLKYCSPNVESICGYSAEELVGNIPDFLFIDEQRERILAFWEELAASPAPFGGREVNCRCKSGDDCVFEVTGIPLFERDGCNPVFRCVLRDITRSKKAADELIRVSTAVSQTHECVLLVNKKMEIVYGNPAFSKQSGYSPEEYLGVNPFILLKAVYPDENLTTSIPAAIQRVSHWKGRIINTRKDGSRYNEHLTISAVRDSEGNIDQFVGVGRDITEELRMEKEVRRAQRLDAIGTLSSGIAHDFNNIISSIRGFADLILEDTDPEGDIADSIRQIHAATDRAFNLVRQILLFGGGRKKEYELVDIGSMIEEIGDLLRSSIPSNIRFTYNLDSEHLQIMADPVNIHQIILNLCTNAIDAMRESGGLLEIRLFRAEVPPEHSAIESFRKGPFAVLSVSDNGDGITGENIGMLFKPFFTTKPVGHGTGMGLAVVSGIVEELYGTISVESSPGEGSTFLIYLPLHETTS